MSALWRENPLVGPGRKTARMGYCSGASISISSTALHSEAATRMFSSIRAANLSKHSGDYEAPTNPALVAPGTVAALLSRYVWPTE